MCGNCSDAIKYVIKKNGRGLEKHEKELNAKFRRKMSFYLVWFIIS